MSKPKVYLAGPEVFFPNALEIGENHKRICSNAGFKGLYPLDNPIPEGLSKQEAAYYIVKSNMKLIQESDYIIANLSNFRGTTEHPSCDSGTAWECGYGLGIGKKVIGYTNNIVSIPKEIINNINLTVICQNFENVFNILDSVVLRDTIVSKESFPSKIYSLTPEFNDIQDANSLSAFYLGQRCGKNLSCIASAFDSRTQIEKFGEFDSNGNSFEDFNYPVNIMIAINTIINFA